MNFTPSKPEKCRHCKKVRGVHKAHTLACPVGAEGRIGFTHYSNQTVFERKP